MKVLSAELLRGYQHFPYLTTPGEDPDLFKGGGVHLRHTSEKGGGVQEGSNFEPNVKKPTTCTKKGGGGPAPWTPPPRIRLCPHSLIEA